jgi:hypothetical protein
VHYAFNNLVALNALFYFFGLCSSSISNFNSLSIFLLH